MARLSFLSVFIVILSVRGVLCCVIYGNLLVCTGHYDGRVLEASTTATERYPVTGMVIQGDGGM